MLKEAMHDVLGAVPLRETLNLLVSAVKALKVEGVMESMNSPTRPTGTTYSIVRPRVAIRGSFTNSLISVPE